LLKFSGDHEKYVVVLQKGVNLCGLTVSSILGFEDVAVRSEKILPGEAWILGATIFRTRKWRL
jgi:chemotaxis protein histidine kinase CheA